MLIATVTVTDIRLVRYQHRLRDIIKLIEELATASALALMILLQREIGHWNTNKVFITVGCASLLREVELTCQIINLFKLLACLCLKVPELATLLSDEFLLLTADVF